MRIGCGAVFEIGGKRYHSYTDLGMIMTTHPVVSPPEPYINLVDVYGRDAPLDFTEALDGHVHYKTRTVSLSFMRLSDPERWADEYSKLISLLHGRRVKVFMDDDPNWYYDCRIVVGEPSYKKHAWYVNIEGTADPYKYFRYTTCEDVPQWVDYGDGIDRNYRDIEVGGSTEKQIVHVPVYGFERDVIPTFYVSGTEGYSMSIRFGSNVVAVTGKGEGNVFIHTPEFPIRSGLNEAVLTANLREGSMGTFNVSIEFRGMKL